MSYLMLSRSWRSLDRDSSFYLNNMCDINVGGYWIVTKEEIVKMIEVLNEAPKEDRDISIPTKLLIDLRNWWIDALSR